MDVIQTLQETSKAEVIKCVEMHTTGEATRIVYEGFPALTGTLLEQRQQASDHYDHVRSRLMLEPRGHNDMYGAILCRQTEHVAAGEAHIGVLFCHNEGWSTMCGHASIALGRFLLDTHDLGVFPNRNQLEFDRETRTVLVKLHAPCGVIQLSVPSTEDGQRSDSSRSVSFLSVPSFAAAIGMRVPILPQFKWPQLSKDYVVVDLAYGGAFYCLVKPSELGFADSIVDCQLQNLREATAKLKDAFNANSDCVSKLTHPELQQMEFLYSSVVVDSKLGEAAANTKGAETGVCFFADSQLDRSPTGSAVCARVALAFEKGELELGESWTYHSLVSNRYGVAGAFIGMAASRPEPNSQHHAYPKNAIIVAAQGKAFYTGSSTFVLEEPDFLGKGGFCIDKL